MNYDEIRFALRHANPVPDDTLTAAEQQRAERELARITGGAPAARPATPASRARRLQALAAAVALVLTLAVGLLLYPGNRQPVASAAEVLATAAEAAGQQSAPAVTALDYLRRIDSLDGAQVESILRTDAAGVVTVQQQPDAAARRELPQPLAEAAREVAALQPPGADADLRTVIRTEFGSGDDQTARGALELLLRPGLRPEQHQQLYRILADLPGNRIGEPDRPREGGLTTIERPGAGISFDLLPESGQLVRVTGADPRGVTTVVDAAGIVGCVSITGVSGPTDFSLACADNNYLLADLQWSQWNAPTATATGTAWINPCDPSCAEAAHITVPVQVTVSERQSCGYHLEVYTRLEVRYSPEVRRQFPQARDEVFELGCQ